MPKHHHFSQHTLKDWPRNNRKVEACRQGCPHPEEQNHTLQSKINLEQKQQTMDRPALQDKKNKLDAGQEPAASIERLVFTVQTERTLNEARKTKRL